VTKAGATGLEPATSGVTGRPSEAVFALESKIWLSALRRRLGRAQKAAGLRSLCFHDLRHSFGSLVVREVDTATLKAWMGHAKITTTERYLHAKPRTSDVARLDRAFAGTSEQLEVDTLNADAEPRRTSAPIDPGSAFTIW